MSYEDDTFTFKIARNGRVMCSMDVQLQSVTFMVLDDVLANVRLRRGGDEETLHADIEFKPDKFNLSEPAAVETVVMRGGVRRRMDL